MEQRLPDRIQRIIAAFLLVGLFVGVLIGGLQMGSFDFSAYEIVSILFGGEHENAYVIWDLRIPRLILALNTGAILALSGFFMQVLIRNPLADPYIMGLTAGAGFGVNLVILGLIPIVHFSIFTIPSSAILGSLVSLLLIFLLGFRAFFEDNAKLLIAGVAVSSIFTALTGLFIYRFADENELKEVIFWTFGSFARAHWPAVYISSALLVMAIGFGWAYARRLDIMMLGDMAAHSLGMNIIRAKMVLLVFTSVIVGGVVAFTGPIGFVGMMIPHFSRSLFGALHRPNIFLGSLMGATYLCGCDVASRWILPPAGLPIGIVTAILGVPFFLYILFSHKSVL